MLLAQTLHFVQTVPSIGTINVATVQAPLRHTDFMHVQHSLHVATNLVRIPTFSKFKTCENTAQQRTLPCLGQAIFSSQADNPTPAKPYLPVPFNIAIFWSNLYFLSNDRLETSYSCSLYVHVITLYINVTNGLCLECNRPANHLFIPVMQQDSYLNVTAPPCLNILCLGHTNVNELDKGTIRGCGINFYVPVRFGATE
jgi:hypothetical protein